MNSPPADLNLVFDAAALRERVVSVLSRRCGLETLLPQPGLPHGVRTSSVLLLLGETCTRGRRHSRGLRYPEQTLKGGQTARRPVLPWRSRRKTRPLSFQASVVSGFVSFQVAMLGRTENRSIRKMRNFSRCFMRQGYGRAGKKCASILSG